eukprot:2105021-Amphidinium_carterae.1
MFQESGPPSAWLTYFRRNVSNLKSAALLAHLTEGKAWSRRRYSGSLSCGAAERRKQFEDSANHDSPLSGERTKSA